MKNKDGASQEDAQCQPSPRSTISHVVSPYHGVAAGLGPAEPCMRFQDLIVEKRAQRINKTPSVPASDPELLILSSLAGGPGTDPKSTRLNSSHLGISYAVFCLKKKKKLIT